MGEAPLSKMAKAIGVAILAGIFVVGVLPAVAMAHEERPTEFPDGTGKVPKYRPMIADPHIVVCKKNSDERIRKNIKDKKLRALNMKLFKQCKYKDIQTAINKVKKKGTTIYVLPGLYREKPTRKTPACAEGLPDLPSYEEMMGCSAAENLIGIYGDKDPGDGVRKCDAPVCNLQIEGTGDNPRDVLIVGGFDEAGEWQKLNGIRGDRSDGLYLKNFAIQLFEFNAIYILETDGFVIDNVLSRWNDEYAYLTFAVDHGLYKNCEAYGNGDSGIYPGSASDVNSESTETGPLKRWAVEIKGCKSHHNALGYSGTAGNSVYAHNNRFYNNATGMVTDSLFPNHPGLPQDHAWWTKNLVYSNNENYFERYVHTGICAMPPAEWDIKAGTVCPVIPAPVGTGIMIAGGNYNYVTQNHIWDNWRNGAMQFGIPAALREEEDPEKQFDTSHFNAFMANLMGLTPKGAIELNGLDFWWDDQGDGNCWQENVAAEGESPTHNATMGSLPDCDTGGSLGFPANAEKQGPLAPCATYDREDPDFWDPPGCDWFDTPPEP